MLSKLWQRDKYDKLDKSIEKFEVGEDYLLDSKLVEYDIYGSIAHCRMLTKIGILDNNEFSKIKTELINILDKHKKQDFIISVEDEDIHTKVENYLTERLGETAKKLHTARSRNDQVLLDIRLYTKKELITLKEAILDLAYKLFTFAKKYEFIPMPGYTHMQLAMPSSIGMWSGAFIESILDELSFINYVYNLNDQCPLGSGAGYGVSIPIDREMTAKDLGFKKLQVNSLYCSNSRGKIEANTISAIVSLGLVMNKISSDLLLFTTKEFDFFDIEEGITTGSSIMPQKKNLDVLELIRAKISSLIGLELSIKSLITNLPSGYNRDFQDTKKFLINAFEIILPILSIMSLVIEGLRPKEDKLIKAHKKEIYSTNEAYKLVLNDKIAFRDAYKQIANSLDKLESYNPYDVVKSTKVIGSTGNLKLDDYSNIIEKEKNLVLNEKSVIETHFKKLLE